jgi:adenine deaminase
MMYGRLANFTLCEYIDTALGKVEPDLVIKGADIVDVNTREVYRSDIVVKKERIVFVGDASSSIGNKTSVIYANGMYAVPGFIDAHLHVESSMLTITEFSRIATQHGTSSIVWDPHELVNVAGLDALRLSIKEARGLPLHVFFVVPSCVPSAPNKETSGAHLTPKEISVALRLPTVVGLGEMMDFPGVLSCSTPTIRKLELARRMRVPIDGHAPGLRGKELCGYITSGVWSDHESVDGEEGLAKLRLGMWLMIRESSTSKDLSNLIKPLVRGTLDTKHCMLVSDDLLVNDLLFEGHMDRILRRAISEGMDPITALQLVTINPASYIRMDNDIGSISPGRVADILLLDDLRKVNIRRVIVQGKELNKVLYGRKFRHPARLTNTIKFRKGLTQSDFLIESLEDKDQVDVRVIKLREGTLYTLKEIARLKIKDRAIRASGDILHAAVVERHHYTGNVGKGFITGLGPLKGAIAQTIAHDSHNLIVVGSDPFDMCVAAKTISGIKGGVTLSSGGKLIASLKLEIAGLMSAEPAKDVAEKKEFLENHAARLGVQVKSPITTLSFLSLPVIPELKLTDKGLFDVNERKFIDPIVK